MKYLRWALALLIVLYCSMTAYVMALTVLFKLGRLGAIAAEDQRFIPLMEATPWWHLGLWLAVVVLYLATSWRLVRGGRALVLFGAAFVLDMAGLVAMRGTEVYHRVFTPQELAYDYYVVGALVVGGLLVWWTERSRAAPARAA